MVSEVKGIMSTDIYDLENYRPDDYYSFSFLLSLTVGPKGSPGADLFYIEVCSPKWLLENISEEVILGRHKVFFYKCDMKWILARIRALFEGCEGKDWDEIAGKLSRIGHWEFEDYQPYQKEEKDL